jgi:hypothetical protein
MIYQSADTGFYHPDVETEEIAVAYEGREVLRAVSMEALVRFLVEGVKIPEVRDLMEKHGIEQTGDVG